MTIKDVEGLSTNFWRAEAYLHDCGHTVYGWATFLLPSLDPRRAPLSYKVVLGASDGLYWVFKHETYPHEHVIPRSLSEPSPLISKPCAQEVLELKGNTVDTTKEVQREGRPHAPNQLAVSRVVRETIVQAPSDASSMGDSESIGDAALTSFSPIRQYDFPIVEVKSEGLSQLSITLDLEGEKHANKSSLELDWLNLAFSDRQENLWPDIPYFEPRHWEPRSPHKPVATVDTLDGAVSQPTEQELFHPVAMPEREEIDLTAAFGGMGATDLDGDHEEPEVTVELNKVNATVVDPITHLAKHPNTQSKCDNVLVPFPVHHENYLGWPIGHKNSTSPEISLWVTHFASKKNAPFHRFSRQGVLASQATKTVDPFQYTGPKQYLKTLTGTKLQDAIARHVNRVYTNKGTWQCSHYEHHEGVPKQHSDVEDFTDFEDGCEGMQHSHYMNSKKDSDRNDVVVNSDCGYLGPPRGIFIDMWKRTCVCESANKLNPYICKFHRDSQKHIGNSPLRNEVGSSFSSENDEVEARMPLIAEEDEDADPKPTVVNLPSTTERLQDEAVSSVGKFLSTTTVEVSPVEQVEESQPSEILGGLAEKAIDLENDEFYGKSAASTDNISLPGSEESEDFDVEDISLPADAESHADDIDREDADNVSFDEDPDYTDSWTKPVRRSSGLMAAHLAKFSEDVVDVLPERTKNPLVAQLARWSDDEDVQDQDFEGELELPEDNLEVSDHDSGVDGGDSVPGAAELAYQETVAKNSPSREPKLSRCSPSGATSRDKPVPDDVADRTMEDVSGVVTDEVPQGSIESGRSPQDNAASSFSSSNKGSPPSNEDESTPTTPDVELPIDLEIDILQERLKELLTKKYERQYPSLEDFGKFGGTKERIPLFPIVEEKTPRAAMKLTGILAQATAKDPEISKYVQSLTDAMASKDLQVKPKPVQEPKPEQKPKPAVVLDAVDSGDSEEAPVPHTFSIAHPSILFEFEVAGLAEVRKAHEAAEALRLAKALKLSDAEMEAAALASELQDLEDNAAINGGHMFFEPVNADVPFVADEASSLITAEMSVINEELEEFPVQPSNPEPIIGTVPVTSYGYYSDEIELHSAPDFNEHLYGTLDLGLAKKVKNFALKLKF